jgi:precorrin-2 dehydrogenase/sirohydrochlorin ferrochelatase
MKTYFPISLDVEKKPCLVIGEGAEAEDKTAKLREAGARVAVVKRFSPRCLRGKFLVMLCVKTDPALTREVFRLCQARKILVCAYDQPKYCDFTMPAILRSGRLCLAISTGGASPALARRMRQEMEVIFDKRMAQFLDWLAGQRRRLEKDEPDPGRRREKLKALVREFKIEAKVEFPKY